MWREGETPERRMAKLPMRAHQDHDDRDAGRLRRKDIRTCSGDNASDILLSTATEGDMEG